MKRIFALALFCFAAASPAIAKDVTFDNGEITLTAPENFTVLSTAEINKKYPSSGAPKQVVGNETRAITIAYDLKPNDISAMPLEKVQEALEKSVKSAPGLTWVTKDVRDINGHKSVYLEFTTQARDTIIHNILIATPYNKQMLVFNFNSTKEEFAKYESALRTSVSSIKFSE